MAEAAAVLDPGSTPAVPAPAPAPAPGPAATTLAAGAVAVQTPPAGDAAPRLEGAPATLAGGSDRAPPAGSNVQPLWPEKWREEMANAVAAGDDKELKRLERMASPIEIWKTYRQLESKVSSGELKAVPKPLAADATPEQVTAWRTEQGLPADAKGYVDGLALPQGVVPGEADKPLLDSFAEWASKGKASWSKDHYNEAVGWYYSLQDELLAHQQNSDAEFQDTSRIELLREWGNEFNSNQTRITQFFEANFSKEAATALLTARTADGRLIGDDPVFNREFLEISKVINPAQTVLPNVAGANLGSVESRIGEIDKLMKAPQGTPEWNSYWRNPAMKDEYLGLLQAREKYKPSPQPGEGWR